MDDPKQKALQDKQANLERGATANAYHLVKRAREITAPGVNLSLPNFAGEAHKLLEDMAFELECLAWWVPEMVPQERQKQFNQWKEQRRKD